MPLQEIPVTNREPGCIAKADKVNLWIHAILIRKKTLEVSHTE